MLFKIKRHNTMLLKQYPLRCTISFNTKTPKTKAIIEKEVIVPE